MERGAVEKSEVVEAGSAPPKGPVRDDAPAAGGSARARPVPSRRRLLRAAATLVALRSVAAAAPAAAQAAPPRLLIVGDSLSAEYGLRRGSGWVSLLEQRLARERPGWQVVNASISGDTTAAGRTRLPGLLARHTPQVVLIELGGNDALRGLPIAATRDNLRAMAQAAAASGARVLIAGMRIPPNYGRAYAEAFERMFAEVARAERAVLVPFLLAGVAERDEWFQPDRIHPTEAAQATILENVWPALAGLLDGTRRS